MALIKCSECGGTISDKATTCPHCGAPVDLSLEQDNEVVESTDTAQEQSEDEEKSKEDPKPKSYKTIIIIAIVVIAAIIAAIVYFKVTADKEPPIISGVESGQTVDVTCGTEFNLNDYLGENLKIVDEKSGDITDYTIKADEKVYDKETGEIDTQEMGEFPITITAQDKAENVATLDFNLKLNPVRITKKKVGSVIYDGEYATVKLDSFTHGNIDGKDQYNLQFSFTNKSDNTMELYLSSAATYINDVNVDAYYTMYNGVKPGKKGHAECNIYEEDIPNDVGKYKEIETALGMTIPEGDTMYVMPMILEVSAAE